MPKRGSQSPKSASGVRSVALRVRHGVLNGMLSGGYVWACFRPSRTFAEMRNPRLTRCFTLSDGGVRECAREELNLHALAGTGT